MFPPDAAIPADVAATTVGALLGPTVNLAALVSLVALAVLLVGLVVDRRDATARARLKRPAPYPRIAPVPGQAASARPAA